MRQLRPVSEVDVRQWQQAGVARHLELVLEEDLQPVGTEDGEGPTSEPQVMEVVALNRDQLSAISDCMHEVCRVSGARLSVTASSTPGMFRLCIVGVRRQVKAAKRIIKIIFQGGMQA
jgi:hypothetical protein